jgi:hypothetical protein
VSTDQQTAVRLHRDAAAVKQHVDALLESLNELNDEELRAVDDVFVLALINAQEHLETAARAALPRSTRDRLYVLKALRSRSPTAAAAAGKRSAGSSW